MPKFVYTGNRRDDPRISDGNGADSIVMYGVTFPKGVVTEVTDPFAVRKLMGNLFFLLVPDAPVGLPVEAPEIGAALTPKSPTLAEMVTAPHPVPDVGPINPLLAPETAAPKKGRRK